MPLLIKALSMQSDSLDWYKIYGKANEHKHWCWHHRTEISEYGEMLTES